MTKKPFVTKEKLEEIAAAVPTPFHIYDEKGIRENAKAVKEAFSWNPGFREYFAVKANPNPTLIKMLGEYDCGCDCSSYTELMLSDAMGFEKDKIMFSSNVTPAAEYQLAAELGAIINLDDITHIEAVEKACGKLPKKISCRYNPGGIFKISNDIMDNPGDAKYGMTTEQIYEAFKILKEKGVEEFGIHSFLCSNTVTNEYYPMLAKLLFELAADLKEKLGVHITFINLSGGIGIPYKPDQEPNDIFVIGEGVRKAYEEVLIPADMGDVSIFTELGRYMLAPNGALVAKAIREKVTAGTKVLIIGAGLIGLKCAEALHHLNADITVVDLADRILPSILDIRAGEIMQKHIEDKGTKFILGTSVEQFSKNSAKLTNGETVSIAPDETVMIHTGFAVEIPEGYAGLIYARSGIATKRGLAPANKVGVIDSDYRGEIMVSLHNHSDAVQEIADGERIAQLVITPFLRAEFTETDELSDTVRGEGGFGSTGS